jgi:ComF family protein
MELSTLVFSIREFFFPRGCALCGTPLTGGDEAWYGLCGPCREQLAPAAGERCGSCGRPLISEQGRCLSCRNGGPRNFDRSLLLFPYTEKYRRLLGAYKFGKNPGLGHFFAEQIRTALWLPGTAPPDARLVPVPPRPGKLRKSGWDQVEFLARLLEKGDGVPPVYRCLKRLASKNQKELNRENRQTNLKGKIVLTREAPRHAVVLDDVCTTGSTLDACAAALKAGGAETVLGLCLFYG